MREIRQSGSEGGAAQPNALLLPLSLAPLRGAGPLACARENAYPHHSMTSRTLLLGSLLMAFAALWPGVLFGAESAHDNPGTAPKPRQFDPLPLLGMDPSSALPAFGPPREIFPFRGAEEGEDNVVFFYDDYLYIFWFRSRVWQVRFDRRFDGEVLGLSLGMTREQVERASTRALISAGDSLYFDVAGAGYPVRVRLVFDSDALSDIYVYRSDY